MSEDSHSSEHIHSVSSYVKIWGILVVLLIISVVGPMAEIKVITLVTAFGIAIVKALMVAAKFMHLNVEKRYIWYLLFTGLLFIFLFFTGIAPDIMKGEGSNWKKTDADYIARSKAIIDEHDSHGSETHEEEGTAHEEHSAH
jgi:caa(3)-type oxidase subunit IV